MKKPTCLSLAILATSETVMYKIWHNYVKPNY